MIIRPTRKMYNESYALTGNGKLGAHIISHAPRFHQCFSEKSVAIENHIIRRTFSVMPSPPRPPALELRFTGQLVASLKRDLALKRFRKKNKRGKL